MASFLNDLINRRRNKVVDDKTRYIELLHKAATADNLTAKELNEFDALIERLGKSTEAVEADASAVRQHQENANIAARFDAALAAKDAAGASWNAAADKLRAGIAAHESWLKSTEAEVRAAEGKYTAAESELNRTVLAKRQVNALEHLFPKLFGHDAPPPLMAFNATGSASEASQRDREEILKILGRWEGNEFVGEQSTNEHAAEPTNQPEAISARRTVNGISEFAPGTV